MGIIKFDEVKKVWHEIARHTSDDNFSFELELHKKLLNIFHVGDYYYYIFNCGTAAVEMASTSVTQVLGLKEPGDFTIEHLLTIIHPEDLPYFLEFESKVTQFFNELPPEKVLRYKVSYDYRVRRQDGSYIRILQQVVTIQSDEKGAVIRVMGVHTDITHLKKPNGSTLSFLGMDGEPSYHDVASGRSVITLPSYNLTRREKEVLKLVMQGKTSSEIAAELFISKLTVEGHRKKLLKKTNCKSTVELTMKMMR